MTKRILLCDDEIHILRAAEFKFKRAGYQVFLAGDGEEAWEIIQRELPDLVVTDCQMPRLSGLGLAERMLQHPETSGIPVLMLSGKGFELSATELRQTYGIRALIGKPFSPRDLFQRVESFLGAEEPAAPVLAESICSQWL